MEKNIKSLFILILFLVVTPKVQAQTQEETIAWLQEKLQKYVNLNCINCTGENIKVEVENCAIMISYSISEMVTKTLIPTINFGLSKNGFFEMKNEVATIRRTNYKGDVTFDNRSSLYIRLGEENLYERVQKAVAHLATFCPKKKEAF
jgi:hypothetical protein